jgi:DNA-binding winged helix-turn-helix (wHTH) protein/TolB-like protein/Flp pilus assembly protein TadD
MQPATPAQPGVLRFGIFELHEASGELRRNGSLVHLAPQPFQILTLLVRNSGEVIGRGRIREEVWSGTTVDFDRSLNVAIAQIRSALNDNAESPRFIQTLPRKGYRFLAPVDSGVRIAAPPPPHPRRLLPVTIGIVLLLLLAAFALRPWRSAAGPVRIAVLPFENLALDQASTVESDGLFDDLLTRLGGVQPDRIQVIGRRSVAYLNTHGAGSLREIGQRLNVSYAVESSVRRESGGLRVAVRLIQTANETVRWSATFTQDAPETVVARASAGVLTALFPGASPRIAEDSCGAGREAFQTGRMLANRGGIPDLQRSILFFQQADCAPASAELAATLVRLGRNGNRDPDIWERARTAAQTALRTGSTNPAAHLALGNVAFWHDWNWQAARREFGEALRLNPSDPDAHHDLAWLQVALGQRADALASIRTAIAIDPLSAHTRMDSAWLLLQIGRFQEAAAAARQTLALNPEMAEARACLSRALLFAGDAEAAKDLKPDGARQPYERAWRLAWAGSRDASLTALEEAFRTHSPMMPLTAVDPGFASIRGEPRFRKIVADLGLGR